MSPLHLTLNNGWSISPWLRVQVLTVAYEALMLSLLQPHALTSLNHFHASSAWIHFILGVAPLLFLKHLGFFPPYILGIGYSLFLEFSSLR